MATEGQNSGDLRATLALSPEEARNGTMRTLTLPGGRLVSITVPAGVYEGWEIRVEGQGQAIGGKPVGALILTVAIASAENAGPLTSQDEENISTKFIQIQPPPPPSDAQSLYASTPSVSNTPYSYYPPQGDSSYYYSQQSSYPQYGQQSQSISGQSYLPAAQKPRSTAITVVLIVLILLVIGASTLIYYTSIYLPQKRITDATATVSARIAGTVQANMASTAHAVSTSQAQASATAAVVAALQMNYDQITATTPNLNDPLQNSSLYNWDTGAGCTFTNGAYHITMAKKGFFLYCTAQNTDFSNFAYQVQMRIVTGDFGGIIFRADTVNTKFYLFRIGQDGSYNLFYYPDKEGTHSKSLVSGISPLINAGTNQDNLIAVIARGSSIDLYINKKYLISVTDSSLTTGKIGVVAEDSTNPADVAYGQVQVWRYN